MSDAQKIIGFGLAIAGIAAAWATFRDDLVAVEHKGLTFASGLALFAAGAHLISTAETVDAEWRGLFA